MNTRRWPDDFEVEIDQTMKAWAARVKPTDRVFVALVNLPEEREPHFPNVNDYLLAPQTKLAHTRSCV
jgi:hypothetical protein